jgi:GNAT superfamily N-acetyltransferase
LDLQRFHLTGLCDPDSPAALDFVERNLWLDLWRAPVLDAAVEARIEARWYGPLQATVVAGLPEEPALNLLLGAAEPGAVEGGHLAEALEWIEGLELDCRIPVDPGHPEAPAAEELLSRWGYRRAESLVRLVRDTSAPGFEVPEGIEVIELEEFTEGFGDLLAEGCELCGISAMFFDCLPQREGWRCYFALDEREHCVAAAAMMPEWGVAAQLGIAATAEEARGRGFYRALLERCIRDAAKSCPTIFAETIEPLGERDGPSPACRNLLRAGFRQDSVRRVWRPARVT